MRQAQISHFGAPDVFTIVDDAPVPEPAADEVIVKVIGTGTNPIDYKIREGSSGVCKNVTEADFPLVLGRECCGEITAVGADVSDLRVGERVFGMKEMTDLRGCYAEYVAFPARCLVRAPEDVDPMMLAGLSLVGLTAWVAVNDQAHVGHEDTVVVHGGAGGVGSMAVQLCIAAGATVYATASGKNRDRIEAMGATFIDYETEDWTQVAPRPSVIIDCVYFGTYEPSMDHLAPGGRLIELPSLADLEPARSRGIDVQIPSISPNRQRLLALREALSRGEISLEVSEVLDLGRVADAHRQLETGHTRGKIVLQP